MSVVRAAGIAIMLGLVLSMAACSRTSDGEDTQRVAAPPEAERESTVWDLFENRRDPSRTYQVNRYIWNASLDVLDFLPLESVDPFTGVIVTGWGRPPNGGQAYRATVRVTDPALDARSLKLTLRNRRGVVDTDTLTAIEAAILTRARQLRRAEEQL